MDYLKYPCRKNNIPKLMEFCFKAPISVTNNHSAQFDKYFKTLTRLCYINDRKVNSKRKRRFKKHLRDGHKILARNYKIAYPYSRELF